MIWFNLNKIDSLKKWTKRWKYLNYYLRGKPARFHCIVGTGSPVHPTSNFNMELADSVTSRILRRSIFGATTRFKTLKYNRYREAIDMFRRLSREHLRKRCLATTVLVGSLGSEQPALLIAMTRNWYSIFSIRFSTLPWQSGPDSSTPLSHITLKSTNKYRIQQDNNIEWRI